jgi:hypothetical protein
MSTIAKNIITIPLYFLDHLFWLIREMGSMALFTLVGLRNFCTGKQFA